jgi:low affinity Fe/Cu permease
MNELFRRFAEKTAFAVGTPWAFVLAVSIVMAWAATGPLFGYSNTWQLVINTGTTIVTFLIVFLIQNTQNRETRIVRLKLDELLRGVEGARTGFVSLDSMTDEELEDIKSEFERLKERYAPLIEDDLAQIHAERESRRARRAAAHNHSREARHRSV